MPLVGITGVHCTRRTTSVAGESREKRCKRGEQVAPLLLMCVVEVHMRLLGVILIVAGAAMLIYGGFSFTRNDTVIDAGPIEINAEKEEHVPISPILGGIILATGAVLVIRKPRG